MVDIKRGNNMAMLILQRRLKENNEWEWMNWKEFLLAEDKESISYIDYLKEQMFRWLNLSQYSSFSYRVISADFKVSYPLGIREYSLTDIQVLT
jgi:hypothetical protein